MDDFHCAGRWERWEILLLLCLVQWAGFQLVVCFFITIILCYEVSR